MNRFRESDQLFWFLWTIWSTDGASALLAGLRDGVVLRHMRRDVHGAKLGHVIGGVIGLVLADRDPMTGFLAPGFEHYLRGAPFGRVIGQRDHSRHGQAVPVLHHGVAHISQLRLAPRCLAIEPAFRVARALMGVVPASLAMEVGRKAQARQ